MNAEEARSLVAERLSGTPEMVQTAKARVFALMENEAEHRESLDIALSILEEMGYSVPTRPRSSRIDLMTNPEPLLAQVAEELSWYRAICEAIWCLVMNGALLLHGEIKTPDLPGIPYRSHGCQSSFDVPMPKMSIPRALMNLPSGRSLGTIHDADLFLSELGTELPPGVEAALREAIACFRQDLFTAAVAMLGKVSEGAWLLVGEALTNIVAEDQRWPLRNHIRDLEKPRVGVLGKIDAVMSMYKQRDFYEGVWERSGVRPEDLNIVVLWSDTVRDSRNAVHYGSVPVIENSYGKVASLLIAAASMLRALFNVKGAAAG